MVSSLLLFFVDPWINVAIPLVIFVSVILAHACRRVRHRFLPLAVAAAWVVTMVTRVDLVTRDASTLSATLILIATIEVWIVLAIVLWRLLGTGQASVRTAPLLVDDTAIAVHSLELADTNGAITPPTTQDGEVTQVATCST